MKKSERTKVLLAEDHGVVLEALTRLINRQPDMACCAGVQFAREIVPSARQHRPGLMVLDIQLKDTDSTDLIPLLVSEFPALRVLIFSRLDGAAHAESILKAGAHGFITKEESPEELLAAIRTVLNGEIYLSRKLAAVFLHRFIEDQPAKSDPSKAPLLPLSHRETEVFRLIGSGKKTSQIAMDLKLSVKTVETHRENIKRKLGIQTASELMLHAVKWTESQVPKALIFKPSHLTQTNGTESI